MSISTSTMPIHDDMDFYVTSTEFVIEPHGKGERLVIHRKTAEMHVETKPIIPNARRTERRICGLLGTIRLLNGFNLIVATHRIFVGCLNGQAIWQLAGFEILPYSVSSAPGAQNDTYLAMINEVLNTPFFYFSYTYDLTHSLQRQHMMATVGATQAGGDLFQRAEKRFTWNGDLLTALPDPTAIARRYLLPLVHGFISVHAINVNGAQFTWALISRRSVQRAGTRLFTRGIDEHGHCANFVETEQIVEWSDERTSFVQTRGSIPLFWKQDPNLKYKPRPQLDAGRDHVAAAALHIDAQMKLYGRQVLVNLIDHRGSEQQLESAFGNIIAQLANPAVRYESFDFHAECSKMRWDRLNILIDRLAHELDEFGLYHARRDGTVALQDGVFRTNCIDCLDRTNVVQSMLAKRSLQRALHKFGILRAGQSVDETAGLSALYKNVWADNADLVSLQYSGTGALKTDFTRTGKRTVRGAMWDGCNSAVRYFKNNFRDGRRQDAIDLLLGNSWVSASNEAYNAANQSGRGWKYNMLPSVLVFASVMFLSTAVLPQEYNTENLLFMMFWGTVVGFTIRGIFANGTEFVDKPRLEHTQNVSRAHQSDNA